MEQTVHSSMQCFIYDEDLSVEKKHVAGEGEEVRAGSIIRSFHLPDGTPLWVGTVDVDRDVCMTLSDGNDVLFFDQDAPKLEKLPEALLSREPTHLLELDWCWDVAGEFRWITRYRLPSPYSDHFLVRLVYCDVNDLGGYCVAHESRIHEVVGVLSNDTHASVSNLVYAGEEIDPKQIKAMGFEKAYLVSAQDDKVQIDILDRDAFEESSSLEHEQNGIAFKTITVPHDHLALLATPHSVAEHFLCPKIIRATKKHRVIA